MEHPSTVLILVFRIMQLVSFIITVGFSDWGFTQIEGISGGWNHRVCLFFCEYICWAHFLLLLLEHQLVFTLVWINFGMKTTVIKSVRQHCEVIAVQEAAPGVSTTDTQRGEPASRYP